MESGKGSMRIRGGRKDDETDGVVDPVDELFIKFITDFSKKVR